MNNLSIKNNVLKFNSIFFLLSFLSACTYQYVTNVNVIRGSETLKENIEVGLLIPGDGSKAPFIIQSSNSEGTVIFEGKDIKEKVKDSKLTSGKKIDHFVKTTPLRIVYDKQGTLFYSGLDTVTAPQLQKVKKKKKNADRLVSRQYALAEKKIPGKMYIYETPGNGKGVATVEIDAETASVSDDGNFLIRIIDKSKSKWTVKVKVAGMAEYEDIDTIHTIIVSELANLELRYKPVPRQLDRLEDEIAEVLLNLNDIEEKIKALEKIRDNLPGGNLHAAYKPIDEKIIYLRNRLNSLRNRFGNLQSSFQDVADKIRKRQGNPETLLRLGELRKTAGKVLEDSDDLAVNADFWGRYATIAEREQIKISGSLFWDSGDYSFDDLPSKGKQSLDKIIKDIRELRFHKYNKDFENNGDFKIYVNIACSADRQPHNSNIEHFEAALNDLNSNYKAILIKHENSMNDLDNYRLSMLRGYTLLCNIMSQFIDDDYKTEIKLNIFGSANADPVVTNSPKDRFAEITYWIEPVK